MSVDKYEDKYAQRFTGDTHNCLFQASEGIFPNLPIKLYFLFK